jgi:hypothetical protein
MKMRTGNRLILILAAVTIAGCVTQEEVRDIVTESNRVTVVNSVSANALPGSSEASDSTWQDVVNRIETFIAEHPDDQRMIAALRIREAVVLLDAEQVKLARAVFDQIEEAQISGARDRAIYDSREALIWWYGWDAKTITVDDRESFQDALTSLAEVAEPLDKKSDIRRFLEETRVRMAVTFAENLTDKDQIRALLPDPLNRYGNTFDTADQAAIKSWCRNTPSDADPAMLSSLRWFSYAPTPFRDADGMLDNICPDCFTPLWLQGVCPTG